MERWKRRARGERKGWKEEERRRKWNRDGSLKEVGEKNDGSVAKRKEEINKEVGNEKICVAGITPSFLCQMQFSKDVSGTNFR